MSMNFEDFLASTKLFENIDLQSIDLENYHFEELNLPEATVVFREGSASDAVYLIRRGEVNILDNKFIDSTNLVSLTDKDFFGYRDIIKRTNRTSTAITMRETSLIKIGVNDFLEMLREISQLEVNIKNLFESEKEEMRNKLDQLIAEEQKDLNVDIDVAVDETIDEGESEKSDAGKADLRKTSLDLLDRQSAREHRHQDERLERMRRTIIEIDEIEQDQEIEKPELPLIDWEDSLTEEDKKRGFGKIVKEDIVIIVVTLDRATMEITPEFKNFILDTITFGSKKVIVDLSRVEFIDSTFLGALVASLKKIVAKKGDLRLVFTREEPLGLLQLTRMDKIFNIYNQISDAVDSF